MDKLSVFIGSSREALDVARNLHIALEKATGCEPQVWDQGVFTPSGYAMESLLEAAHNSDFAVLIATPDDLIESRGTSAPSPRDNVLFELGLFMGVLGFRRVFILCPEPTDGAETLKLPSDLYGLIRLPDYRKRNDGNLLAALNDAAQTARGAMSKLGARRPTATQPEVPKPAVEQFTARPLPRNGLDMILTNSRPGQFAERNPNRASLHLRAVWRPAVIGPQVDRLVDPASFTRTVPTSVFERWHDYYSRHGGVGAALEPRLDHDATYDGAFVAVQDCAKGDGGEPQASVRSVVALLDVGTPALRFLADLSLSADTGPLPLDAVLASLRDLAQHATQTLPGWLVPSLTSPLTTTGVLELHMQGRGALRKDGVVDSLESYLDLSLLGTRSKATPVSAVWAGNVDLDTDDALRRSVPGVIVEATTNWGYFAPPANLQDQLAALIDSGVA